MILQVGVKIALKNKKGELLLVKRSGKYKKIEGQWDFVGGRINPGTPLRDNLKREIKEETSLNWNGIPKLIYAQDIIMPKRHVVRLTFTGNINDKRNIKLDESENIQYGWFTLNELKRMPIKEVDRLVREIVDRKLI